MQVSCNKKVYPFCDVYALSNNMNATHSRRVKLFAIGVYAVSTTQFYDYGNNIVVVVVMRRRNENLFVFDNSCQHRSIYRNQPTKRWHC